MSQLLLGIDLGGTNIKTALVNDEKQILAKESRPTNAQDGVEAVLDQMAEAARAVAKEFGLPLEDIAAACIGAPGPLSQEKGVVYSPPNLPGWKDVPLADHMSHRLGIPCIIENDANAACYGEFWMGAGQGSQTMVLLTLGTGVGGGIITNGKLLRGVDGTAGEIGHMKVQGVGGRTCGCGATGCLEAYASVTGMLQTAREGLESGVASMLSGSGDTLTGETIAVAAAGGDEFATDVMNTTARWLGIGISSLINLFNPEKVVLAGGMANAGEHFYSTLRKTAASQSFEVPANTAQIVRSTLGNDAGVLGCAGIALDSINQ
jgi:glucokinase